MGQTYVITVEVFDKSSTKVYISDVSLSHLLAPRVDDCLSAPSFWLGSLFFSPLRFQILPLEMQVATLLSLLNRSVCEECSARSESYNSVRIREKS